MIRLIVVALLALTALLPVVGCGGDDSPEDTVTAFYDAVEATEATRPAPT